MRKAEFKLEQLTCPTCVKKIEGTLGKMDGIKDVRVLFNASKVKLNFDESKTEQGQITRTIEKLGYEVLNEKVS